MLQENQELIKLLFTVLFAFLSIIILVIISIYFFSKKEIKFKNDLNELKNKQEKARSEKSQEKYMIIFHWDSHWLNSN
jgi:uncharacterized protein YxeA